MKIGSFHVGRVSVGIDFSMSCPALVVHVGDEWSFDNCSFYYLTARKKSLVCTETIYSELHQKFTTQEERFDHITEFIVKHIPQEVSSLALEGYSYASMGSRIFEIGENTGLLKHKIYRAKYSTVPLIVAPTTIKKFASGRGNATKLIMHNAFCMETKTDLSKFLNCEAGDSPASDLVDSYYICKYGFTNKNK